MPHIRRPQLDAMLTAMVATSLALAPTPVAAQSFFGLGGAEVRAGIVLPEDAKTGFGASADLDLGYLRSPIIRAILGVNYFKADVDRQVGGTDVGGSFSATGGRVGVRLDPLRSSRFSPYVTATVTGHSVSASVSDQGTADLLDGFYVGAGLGGGFAFSLDSARRMMATVEARRVFITNAGHTALEAGFRWMPRGPRSYTDERGAARAAAREAEARLAAERQRAEQDRQEAERARLAAEQAANAQSEAELARIRGEREANRLAAERAREMELEQARRAAAAAELDRVRGQAQTEVERLRRQADSAEARRRAEAAGRVAAEADAAAARQRADAAQAATRAAENRAAESERLRYEALLNLDRLIADVTEIRESERGLAVVLGQGLFASGQSDLSTRARSQIGPIAAVLAQYRDNRIAVEGHTDAVGSEVSNQRLSERRAESVRAALIAEGVDPSRIDLAGYGQNRPIADNGTADGRARNRRVEIVITGATRPGR